MRPRLAAALVATLAGTSTSAGPFGVPAAGAQAPSAYTFVTLTAPGATSTVARGINAAGQVAGYYTDAAGTHGFLYSGGAYQTLNVPGAAYTAATGVNASGQIVGSYRTTLDPQDPYRTFVFGGGAFAALDLSALGTYATAATINDLGQVAGVTGVGGAYGSVYVYDPRTGAVALTPNPSSAYHLGDVWGVNNAGQTVGSYAYCCGTASFVAGGGQFSTYGFSFQGGPYLFGLNNIGQVVGSYSSLGFLGSAAGFNANDTAGYLTFAAPGAASTSGYGVNDLGQIVGVYADAATGVHYSFLATPVGAAVTTPEPGPLALAAAGLGVLGAAARRRR